MNKITKQYPQTCFARIYNKEDSEYKFKEHFKSASLKTLQSKLTFHNHSITSNDINIEEHVVIIVNQSSKNNFSKFKRSQHGTTRSQQTKHTDQDKGTIQKTI